MDDGPSVDNNMVVRGARGGRRRATKVVCLARHPYSPPTLFSLHRTPSRYVAYPSSHGELFVRRWWARRDGVGS